MVERCADCGFDLAAGRVEVIPTAHYMMGGVVFDTDCATPMHRLFAAGEDTGGVHGDPDPNAIDEALSRAEAPFRNRAGDLHVLRERLYDVMWDDVGILRTG